MDYMDRIKAEREDHDESQRDIAKVLNMPQSQYQKYEAKNKCTTHQILNRNMQPL